MTVKNTFSRYGKIIGFVGTLSMIFILDTLHQREYEEVRAGYAALEAAEYEDAYDRFTEYLSAHKSDMYWDFVEIVNGEVSCLNKEKVEDALGNSLHHLSERTLPKSIW